MSKIFYIFLTQCGTARQDLTRAIAKLSIERWSTDNNIMLKKIRYPVSLMTIQTYTARTKAVTATSCQSERQSKDNQKQEQ